MSIGQNVRPAPKSRNLSCRASCGRLICAFSEPVKAEKYLEKTTWAKVKLGHWGSVKISLSDLPSGDLT